jgi:hypothetical protein
MSLNQMMQVVALWIWIVDNSGLMQKTGSSPTRIVKSLKWFPALDGKKLWNVLIITSKWLA